MIKQIPIITEPEQAKESGARQRFKRDQELDDIRSIIATESGRRFLARLLAHCKVSRSVWQPSAAIHRDAGIQEVGHFVLGEVVAADRRAAADFLTEAYEQSLSTTTHKENR